MLLSVNLDELFGDFLSSVWGGIVNNDNFPIELAEKRKRKKLLLTNVHIKPKGFKQTYFSLKVLARSQMIIGKFWRKKVKCVNIFMHAVFNSKISINVPCARYRWEE